MNGHLTDQEIKPRHRKGVEHPTVSTLIIFIEEAFIQSVQAAFGLWSELRLLLPPFKYNEQLVTVAVTFVRRSGNTWAFRRRRHLVYNVTSFSDTKALTISTQLLLVASEGGTHLLYLSTESTLNMRTNGTKGLFANCFSSKTKKNSPQKLLSHICALVFCLGL